MLEQQCPMRWPPLSYPGVTSPNVLPTDSHAARQNRRTRAKNPSPRAISSSPRRRVPPPARGSSNTGMALAFTDENTEHFFHAIDGDEERGTNQDEDSHGNDVGVYTQPASGVAGTSSACYPSHRDQFKFT